MVDYFVSFGIKDIIDVVCVSLLLFYLYKLMKRTGSLNMFIGILVFILVWIVKIQTTYTVDPRVIGLFRPVEQKHVDQPVRGKILATDGRPLAISAPLYDLYMDCTVRKKE